MEKSTTRSNQRSKEKTDGQNNIRQIFSEVILGRLSANCAGFGICKLEKVQQVNSFYQSNDDCGCGCSGKVYAIASLKATEYFELTFFKNSITSKLYEKHFGTGKFKVEETIKMDRNLLGQKFKIKSGLYKIKSSETFLTVRFNF